ncbi:peptidoglycan DD-metalloendopeptidase family protein [Cyclobacterium roseum]|uniref:peptidoglycan DD-metalloendopeptidase family protein n=1 Tax=Cyclobacterium roseum TaxID=2666137 RepID=UPI001390A842|nr:peptidoglycan DD-metalloendopeptidase family protein [Cyclobacterium roseum]
MSIQSDNFFPIMGEELTCENCLILDMSAGNLALQRIDLMDTFAFESFVAEILAGKGKKYGIGGYAENRSIYQRSMVFADNSIGYRNIHLGVDIWTAAATPVFCPLDGKVHSFQDNAGFGNYGPTVILEHFWRGQKIHSLYGHLSQKDLEQLKPGQIFLSGEKIGHLGQTKENGHWPPHVHFQIIHDLGNRKGDYPGVCSESEKESYLFNCPDPSLWLGELSFR